MVLEDHMLLPSKEVYVGQEADTFRSQNPKHAVSTLHHLHDFFSQLFLRLKIMVFGVLCQLLVPFLADVRKAYVTTAVYL